MTPTTYLDWMRQGTELFLATVEGLADDELDAPTLLPDWTRRHLVAHVHHNAEALRRLLSWARTGQESRMYAGPQQRADEIASGARLPAAELRGLLAGSAQDLAEDAASLPDEAWSHEVQTAQGRTVTATEVPWMRTREVAVHAVDLAAGVGFADLPDELNSALVLDVAGKRTRDGEAAALAGWLTGRDARAPELGPWL